MDSANTDGAREHVYGDLRQLLTPKARMRARRARNPIRLLLTWLAPGNAAEFLESSTVSLFAGCLCLVMAGLSLFVIHRVEAPVSADFAAPAESEPLFSQPTSIEQATDQTQGFTTESNETFIIRVGTFKNPSNARRVAESLEQQSLYAETDVLADGLHVVTLGPFSRKETAEEAARSVQEIVGLVPQVLRRNFQ
jgi:sporulation related protein